MTFGTHSFKNSSLIVIAMVQINPSDHVHLDRLLVVRCRSKFVADPEAEGDNTFQEVPDFSDKLREHRSDVLAWALEGLRNYWIHRLAAVPPALEQWKRELGGSQDLLSDWVMENLEQSDSTSDFVRRSEVYAAYRCATEEERDRKAAMGKQKFFHKLLLVLGEENYRTQIRSSDGVYKDCFRGWRFVR